jgi:hypothetical protein
VSLAALAGLGLLGAAVVIVMAGLALTLPPLLRLRRRAVALEATIAEARQERLAAMALLHERRAETEALLAPWRQLQRWARHPLVAATFDWYRRRRARR